jgi:hypothetical protein
MPLPTIGDAIAHEPQLLQALRFVRSKALLDETGIALLEEHFAAVRMATEPVAAEGGDLMVPAVLWLTYLAGSHDRPGELR